MREIALGVLVGTIALALAMTPTGGAWSVTGSQGDCWISINDPTNPTWTDECEEIPDVRWSMAKEDGRGDCWISINDPTNPTWTDECEELPRPLDLDARAETSRFNASAELDPTRLVLDPTQCTQECPREATVTATVEISRMTLNVTATADGTMDAWTLDSSFVPDRP